MRIVPLLVGVAAFVSLAALVLSPGSARAIHLCPNTGSPFGPFDLRTYEAGDWRNAYGRTLELAGFNQLFPEVPSFTLPSLETGARWAGSGQLTSPYIPPTLLKAIAWLESTWVQADWSVPYGSVGPVLVSHDCGYGIMQVTTGMQNISGVPNLDQAMIGGHYGFNIARGTRILADKWNLAPEYRPVVGGRNPTLFEDWYYAVWGYNGFAFKNHPLNADYPGWPRVPYSCGPQGDGLGHDRSQYPYQELVLGCLSHPPVVSSAPLWSPQEVQLPNPADPAFGGPLSLGNWNSCAQFLECSAMDMPTPNPWHGDPTTPVVDRAGAIGVPSVSVSPSGITLAAQPGAQSLPVSATISNAGTGVLAWRLSSSVPWLKVSPVQGVSLGGDIGSQAATFSVSADATNLLPGSYVGQITVESLYAVGAFTNVPVTVHIAHFPDGTPVKGSGPTVYVIQAGLRRNVVSAANFLARGFSWDQIVPVTDSWLGSIPTGQPLLDALATGNLLKGSTPDVYVMENGQKRHVVSAEVFLACGYGWDAVRTVLDSLLSPIPAAAPLDGSSCPRPSFPDGTLLRGSDASVWVMVDGAKRWATSAEVFLSCGYEWGNINRIADSTLAAIPGGPSLSTCLPDGTLLRGSGPDVFIMQHGLKRHLVSAANFLASGFSWDQIVPVTDGFLNSIPTGQPLLDALATGNLLKGSAPDVYVMQNGQKRHAVSAEAFLACGYGWDAVFSIPDSLLGSIPAGPSLDGASCPKPAFAHGTLLRGSDAGVWVVAAGTKRWTTSAEVFLSCDYRWGNINRIADSTLAAIPNGAALSACIP